jgi:hypothetical protein
MQKDCTVCNYGYYHNGKGHLCYNSKSQLYCGKNQNNFIQEPISTCEHFQIRQETMLKFMQNNFDKILKLMGKDDN